MVIRPLHKQALIALVLQTLAANSAAQTPPRDAQTQAVQAVPTVHPQQSDGVVLDRSTVIARAQEHSPAAQLSAAQVRLAAAHRVGAAMFVRENPTLSVWSGPRVLATGDVLADLTLSVSWPFDLSGSRSTRTAHVERGVRVADAEAQVTQQIAAWEALELWLRAISASKRIAVEQTQVTLAQTALRIAETRRTHGVVGDEEPLLASLALSTAQARAVSAQGEARALVVQLKSLLAMSDASVGVGEEFPRHSLPTLEQLLAHLDQRPDVLRCNQSIELARADVMLQQRLAYPLPRLGLAGGRENEFFARVGLDISLPVFQRNQTAIAVAQEQVAVRVAERAMVLRRAETEVRAAYARYESAQSALTALQSTVQITAETERLATRAFELGQRELTATLVVYREAALARAAHLEATINVALAQFAVERAAGVLSP